MIRIIDNKKIDLTNDEWTIFNKICDSYKQYGGEQLFNGLFETDKEGIIMYLIPPSKKQTSLEIFLFLVSVFNHQHIRLMYKQMDEYNKKIEEKFLEIDKKLTKD